jgi:hypothetical protein
VTSWRHRARYLLKQGAATSQARIEAILRVRDVGGLSEAMPAEGLALNDIAQVKLKAGMPLLANRFMDVPTLGGFILINPLQIKQPLQRSYEKRPNSHFVWPLRTAGVLMGSIAAVYRGKRSRPTLAIALKLLACAASPIIRGLKLACLRD